MKLRLILVCLCCVFILKSQESYNLDSVKNHFYSLENSTEKVDKILELFLHCKVGVLTNEDEFEIATYTLKISKDLNYKKGEIISLEKLGNVYYHYNNFVKSKSYFEEKGYKIKKIL